MNNIVRIKPKGDSQLLAFTYCDNKIKILNYSLPKLEGEESGWIRAGNKNKIQERFKYLQFNVYVYQKNVEYSHKSVIKNLESIINESDNKIAAFRKVIDIVSGSNATGSHNIKVEINKITNLSEFLKDI